MSVFASSKDARNIQISDLVDLCTWNVFVWKIPSLSSIRYEVDYVVQSPVFHHQNTPFILKMYPCGQTEYHTEDHMDLIIENLNSSSINFSCNIYYRNASDEELNHKSMRLDFDSRFKCAKVHRFMSNPGALERNKPFILVFEAEDSKDTSTKSSADEKMNRKNRNPVIGEIIKEHLALSFWWKVYSLPSPTPADYHAPSPEFSFANASWVLKAIPCDPKHSSRRNNRVLLERLDSEISEHNVIVKISPKYPTESFQATSGSYVFKSSATKAWVLNFPYESCFRFTVDLKIKSADIVPAIVVDKKSESSKNKVLQTLKEIFLKQEDCDVIFKVGGQELPAHRLILKARSPVLASAFRNDMKERETGVIDVEDCAPSHFQDFLHFLYCGEVEKLTKENVFGLFTVADKYDVPDLRDTCLEFMIHNLSIDTFCDTIALALLHSETGLIKLSTDFFAKNLQKIITTVKWQSFIIENPIQGNELMIKALVPEKK